MQSPALKRFLLACLFSLLAVSGISCKKAPPDASAALYPYEGTYEFGPGHRITMGFTGDMGGALVWLDLKTLKVGQLEVVKDGVFKDHNDKALTFEFSKDTGGKVSGLKLVKAGATTPAKKVRPHTLEEVTFESSGRKLSGNLYLPAGPGKHPLVVFAHGSGPTARGVGPFTTFFLQLGIGVLNFDKQGTGKSEGEWQIASFDDLAADVIAAVDYASSRPEVDAGKVGVMGSSQGGWIGSMAAAKRPELAFLLMNVGPGQSVRDTMAQEKRGQMIVEGVTDPKDQDTAIAMYNRYWDVAVRGGTWEEGNKHFLAQSQTPWFKKAFGEQNVTMDKELARWWMWLGRNLEYDSTTYLSSVKKTPVLWALAEKDWNVNSQASAPRIREALRQAGNPDVTVTILPNMGHTGMVVKTGLPNDPMSWQYAPGYWDGMTAWLTQRGIAR